MPNLPQKNMIKYTLAPLVENGRNCLVCRDVEGMERVILKGVEFYYGGSHWQRITHKSDDIFALVENQIFKWPALERISAARFQIRLKGEQRGRALTVRPSTRSADGGDRAKFLIDEWLMKRGFALIQEHEAKSLE